MSFPQPAFPSTFDVGTPGGGHMHFAQDGSQTLYGPDGVTVLASLDPINGFNAYKGTITGLLIRTAAAGARWELVSPPLANSNELRAYSGLVGEVNPFRMSPLANPYAMTFFGADFGQTHPYWNLVSGQGAADDAVSEFFVSIPGGSTGGHFFYVSGYSLLQNLANNASKDVLTLQGATGQIGDLTKWKDISNNIIARLTAAGLMTTKTLQVGTPVASQPANGIVSQGDIVSDSAVRAPNQAKVTDSIGVNVTIPAAGTNGSQAFTWPKNLFTATPQCEISIIDGTGTTVGAGVRLTGVSSTGATALVHVVGAPASATVVQVHVSAQQQ